MAKDKKICPLTYTSGKGAYDQEVSDFDYCVEKQCAWWDDITGLCAIAVIARFGAEGAFHVGRREQKADMEGK